MLNKEMEAREFETKHFHDLIDQNAKRVLDKYQCLDLVDVSSKSTDVEE